MAAYPSPLNFLSPSHHLYFHNPLFPTHSPTSFRTLRFKLYCSQTTHSEITYTTPTRKKRKPRPSFLEKIQEKWSVKPTSPRKNFPWQEQKSEETVKEISEPGLQCFANGTEHEEEKVEVSDSVSSSNSRIEVKLPPWAHGALPREHLFSSDARILQDTEEESINVSETFENGDSDSDSDSRFQVLKALVEEVSSDSEVVETDNFTSNGIISQKSETLVQGFPFSGKFSSTVQEPNFDGESENEGFQTYLKENSSKVFKNSVNVRGLNDPNDLLRLPWEGGSKYAGKEKLGMSNTQVAEKSIPELELKRLRNVALRTYERIKVGAAGITQALVDSIHEKWKEDEIVKLKFEGPHSHNMKRTHEMLEAKTGGLVIWRSGSSIVIYRGLSYAFDCVKSFVKQNQANLDTLESSRDLVDNSGIKYLNGVDGASKSYSSSLTEEEKTDLSELNLLLDELGPRFEDWNGRYPLPVDADLLPAVVPGYKPPFRRLPYGVRQNLRDREMTYFRRTARGMPPHFALGRNRELQGLAAAMVKLWERNAIAKIAIKRGVHNTCNERMAEELKVLTGGTLLSRNKDYIVFYRGNDFLAPAVTEALKEAETRNTLQQEQEEQARQAAAAAAATSIVSNRTAAKRPLVAGTLAETIAATSRWANPPSNQEIQKMMKDAAEARHATLIRFLEHKLALANRKVRKAERALQKLQKNLEPSELPTDLETLTSEERFLFRKMGLSMKPFLVLGRREVFDGTIQNIHLHWKYRELVKINVERKTFPQVKHFAITLEAESGGVLVSIDKTTRGHSIILYRGKNYQRPSEFRPKNLLTRRQALARSIELQRREALKHHILELKDKIENMKSDLDETKTVKEIDEEALYSRLEAFADDEDMEEDENDEVDLEE
ncbi:PREDICTED: CRM-domain containing factor CFM3, chloroplastic/mitochondrial [Ipomoea nil]|uniref:CRM-domain containing factor CFM3, chloroplastic/mitochondrial n=1 Tax=Ipomoea nil TaxID=35883 RepID=UPI000901B717|nr:PREDICTED: CRM-domain containing factor CFM3, chloroplastic/mitochondrial [Ipomoea nil]